MLNRVFLTRESWIQIDVVGDQTYESVAEMGDKIRRYVTELRARGLAVLVIDNISEMGVSTPEARREVANLGRNLEFDRCVLVGDGSVFMRYGTNLILRSIGRSNVRYFSRRDAAVKWLTQDAPVK